MPRRFTRQERGIAQNIANQLAQMAVGWEILPDGPTLVGDGDGGVAEIDVVREVAFVNQHPAELTMTQILRRWAMGELRQHDLPRSWLSKAIIEMRYSPSAGGLFGLEAEARVETGYGAAVGTFANSQGLRWQR